MVRPLAFEARRGLLALHLAMPLLATVETHHGRSPRRSSSRGCGCWWGLVTEDACPAAPPGRWPAFFFCKCFPGIAVVGGRCGKLSMSLWWIVTPRWGLLGATRPGRRPRKAGRGTAIPIAASTTLMVGRPIPGVLVAPGWFGLGSRALAFEHGGAELRLPSFSVRGRTPWLIHPASLTFVHPPLGPRAPAEQGGGA